MRTFNLVGLALACGKCGEEEPKDETAPPVCMPAPSPEIELEPAFPNLEPFEYPVMVTRSGEDWYAIQLTGQVLRFGENDAKATLVLDISDRVDAYGNSGLTSLALAPDFETSQIYYVWYGTSSAPVLGDGSGAWRARLSRFTIGSDAETVLLEVEEPEESHIHANDDMQFGPDGMLYISLGDGGPPGDGNAHSQDLGVLQAKLLRIQVGPTGPYTIPADNPFVGVKGARPEIWAYGLRNPWRFGFAPDGAVWVGDVGASSWEEIDRVEAGDNMGWVIKEGTECFAADTCDDEGLVDPVVELDHGQAVSIIGGRFYEGTQAPTLAGHYVFADFGFGAIWAFGEDRVPRIVNSNAGQIVSLTVDPDGEILVVNLRSGLIYRLVDGGGEPGVDPYPQLLSQTGCVVPTAPDQPIDDFYAYSVNVPFWSDGAEKTRWLAVPDGTQMTVEDDGDITLPEGSVLLKEFRLGGELVETRIMSFHGENNWSMLSYQWDADHKDATLLGPDDGPTVAWPAGDWTHPTRGMCRQCHGLVPGISLGLEVRQLNGPSIDERLGSDQMEGFVSAGIMPPVATQEPFRPLDDESARIDERARAFLHTNCSYCHRPLGNAAGSDMDLRYDTPMGQTGTCGVAPQFGAIAGPGSKIIAPGQPDLSVLLTRISIVGEEAMPPLGRSTVDTEAVDLLKAWIEAMPDGTSPSCTLP